VNLKFKRFIKNPACYLKLNSKDKALIECVAIQKSAAAKPADKIKAYYRGAQAQVPGDYEAALKDLEAALQLDPNDNDVKTLQAQYKKEVQARKDKEKKAYANMFK